MTVTLVLDARDMAIENKEELGRRLKVARENAGVTQEDAANEMGITRGALAQMEGGMRAPNSLQISKLADLYRRDIGDFFRSEFDEAKKDALAVLFRMDAQLAGDPSVAHAVRSCATLCREYRNLEILLELDRDRLYPVIYDAPSPRTRWEAIRQGERLADLERGRLRLGDGPVRDIAELLEPQGLRLLELSLPENISGLFLNDPQHGLSITINTKHHPRRKLFSYAHEYCHALVDRDRTSLVSKAENREELSEVRANAFAAAFLMPESGVRAFIQSMGKGEPSRSVLQAYDETEAVVGQKRSDAFSQDLQVYDVVHLAHNFGVSYESALYRLLNLKLLSEEEHHALSEQRDLANTVRALMESETEEAAKKQHDSRHRFLLLALEASRREIISRGKLRELGSLAGVSSEEIEKLVVSFEDEKKSNRNADEIYIPKGR